jgi:hypothetical protein
MLTGPIRWGPSGSNLKEGKIYGTPLGVGESWTAVSLVFLKAMWYAREDSNL